MKILGILRFELLITDPEAEARRFSELLGVDFEDGASFTFAEYEEL